jgi:hypothetical protein
MHPVQRRKDSLAIPAGFERMPFNPVTHELRELWNGLDNMTVAIDD